MKSLLLILLIFILSSCAATKTVYVPVENKTTEYTIHNSDISDKFVYCDNY